MGEEGYGNRDAGDVAAVQAVGRGHVVVVGGADRKGPVSVMGVL